MLRMAREFAGRDLRFWDKVATSTNYQLEVDFAAAGRPSFSTTMSNNKICHFWATSASDSSCNRSAWTP